MKIHTSLGHFGFAGRRGMIQGTHYTDPRLAALYDALNPPGADTDFYLRLAQGAPKRVLDLGCGTGQLAAVLASRGHAVTGVDPAAAMLEIGRRQPDGERVDWVEGDARGVALDRRFDLIIMTGHAFQVFLTDADIRAVLANARRHLAPEGRFALETRNPAARAWEGWTPEATRRHVTLAGIGAVEIHIRVTSMAGDVVGFETHHRFAADGALRISRSRLRFLDQAALAGHLVEAGFGTVRWAGDWDGSPITPHSREIIAVAG
jgi:SAM-dependent methyltransferase